VACETTRTFLSFFFQNPENMTFYVFSVVARFLEHCSAFVINSIAVPYVLNISYVMGKYAHFIT